MNFISGQVFRRTGIAFAILLYIALAFGLAQRPLTYSLNSLLNPNHPAAQTYERFEDLFGKNKSFYVLFKGSASQPPQSWISVLKQSHQTLKKQAGITSLKSLYNAEFLSLTKTHSFLNGFVNEQDELSSDFESELSDELWTDTYTNASQDSYLLIGEISSSLNLSEERKVIQNLLLNLKVIETKNKGWKIHILSPQVAQYYYYLETLKSQRFLTPLFFLLLTLVLLLAFKSMTTVLIFSAATLLNYSSLIYIITFIEGGLSAHNGFSIFFILIISTSDLVHYFNALLQKTEQTLNEQIGHVHQKIYWPCFLTSLTTTIGFLSLLFSDLRPIQQMGIYCSIGTVICFLLTFYLLPFALKVFKFDHKKNSITPHPLLQNLGPLVQNNRKKIILSSAALTLLFSFGALSLENNDSIYDKFSKTHPLTLSIESFTNNLNFLGSLDILVTDRNPQEPLEGFDQDLLKFEESLKALDNVARISSKNSYKAYIIRKADSLKLKPNEKAKRIQSLNDLFERNNAFQSFHQEATQRISILLKQSSSDSDLEIIKKTKALLHGSNFKRLNVEFSGFSALRSYIYTQIIYSMLKAFVFSLLLIFIVFWITFGSVNWALLALIPNILPLVFIGGLLGYLNIKLESNSVLLISIVIGIAVDDTIHFLYALKKELRLNKSIQEAVNLSLKETSQALTTTTLVFCASMPCFLFGGLKIFSQIGIFITLSLVVALAADLLLLPSILTLRPKK